MLKKAIIIIGGLLFMMWPGTVFGDTVVQSDTAAYTLSEIVIQAAREMETERDAPFSVSVITRSPMNQLMEPGFSLESLSAGLPGLWVSDRHNDAVGERIAIRGMGWRASFGVRGVQVLMDDIPLTAPDGQTMMDVLDPAMTRQIELIRGPSSSFWGNASGGTLFFSTRPASWDPSLNVRFYSGSYGTHSALATGSWTTENRRYHVSSSYFQREGYRNHSRHEIIRLTAHMEWDFSDQSRIRFSGAFVDAPDTRHPGALTAEELQSDRRMAASFFENAEAGKSWRQAQAGVTFQMDTDTGTLRTTVYGISRSLHNPLPFADIEVDRLIGGTRVTFENTGRVIHWAGGVDAAVQSDARVNYAYANENFVRGHRTLDQNETVVNGALFARAGTDFDYLNAVAGLRYDIIRFENMDQLLAGGEDRSGNRTFTSINPSIGVSYRMPPGLIYINAGTSFETPTTTELVNHPDMTGGFNPTIQPERARGIEAGFRGAWPGLFIRYEVAVFRMQVRDQLISFRTEEGGSRDFYRNAGKTRHDGFEVSLRWRVHHRMGLMFMYNRSHFTFRETVDSGQVRFERGNKLPGIPDQRLAARLSLTPSNVRLDVTFEYSGSYYVNNENSETNAGYGAIHLRMAHTGIMLAKNVQLTPFIAVNNVTDKRYNGSVSINANAGRYFEPAPGRTLFFGFSIGI